MYEEVMDEGVGSFGPVKTIQKFFLDTLEQLMKYWIVGSYLVLKITPRVPGGRTLLAVGHK